MAQLDIITFSCGPYLFDIYIFIYEMYIKCVWYDHLLTIFYGHCFYFLFFSPHQSFYCNKDFNIVKTFLALNHHSHFTTEYFRCSIYQIYLLYVCNLVTILCNVQSLILSKKVNKNLMLFKPGSFTEKYEIYLLRRKGSF